MIVGNLNDVLTKLTKTFTDKEITLTTIEEEVAPKKLKGRITGLWCDADKQNIHFVFIQDGAPVPSEICIPINITKENDWCFLPHQFGSSFCNAIKIPEIEDIPSFLNVFHACLK